MYSILKVARVHEVILTGSADQIGTIKCKEVTDPKSTNTGNLETAKPLFPHITYIPTINELVHIVAGNSNTSMNAFNSDEKTSHYYLPPINLRKWNANNNAQPNSKTEEEMEANSNTGLDPYFTEIKNVKPLHPFGGDMIIEGRYGNSIRFGSTTTPSSSLNPWSDAGTPGNPITIIRNGQSGSTEGFADEYTSIVEDINHDDSSIYLCTNQQINNFKKAGVSPEEYPASYKHMLDD